MLFAFMDMKYPSRSDPSPILFIQKRSNECFCVSSIQRLIRSGLMTYRLDYPHLETAEGNKHQKAEG